MGMSLNECMSKRDTAINGCNRSAEEEDGGDEYGGIRIKGMCPGIGSYVLRHCVCVLCAAALCVCVMCAMRAQCCTVHSRVDDPRKQ